MYNDVNLNNFFNFKYVLQSAIKASASACISNYVTTRPEHESQLYHWSDRVAAAVTWRAPTEYINIFFISLPMRDRQVAVDDKYILYIVHFNKLPRYHTC